jgi:ribosomal protein L31E
MLPAGPLAAIAALPRIPVSRPTDASESEARRIGSRLARPGSAGPVTPLSHPALLASGGSPAATLPGHALAPLLGGGRPLPAHQRGFYAGRLGPAATAARLHVGPEADGVASTLGVAGLSVGPDVAIRSDRYRPARPDGGAILRHEMVHAAQAHAAGRGAGAMVQMVKGHGGGSDRSDMQNDVEDVDGEGGEVAMALDESASSHASTAPLTAPATVQPTAPHLPARHLQPFPVPQPQSSHLQPYPFFQPQHSQFPPFPPSRPQPARQHQPLQHLFMPGSTAATPMSASPAASSVAGMSVMPTASITLKRPRVPSETLPDESAMGAGGGQGADLSRHASLPDAAAGRPEPKVRKLERTQSAPVRASTGSEGVEDPWAPPETRESPPGRFGSLPAESEQKERFRKGKIYRNLRPGTPPAHGEDAEQFADKLSRQMFSDAPADEAARGLKKEIKTWGQRLDRSDAAYAASVPARPEVQAALKLAGVDLALVEGLIDEAAQGLALAAGNAAAQPDRRRLVYPHFGPVTLEGMGTYAAINVDSNTALPVGSAATASETHAPWQGKLERRRWGRGNGKLYIRGHLLNAHAGGPATPVNLVPLVGLRTSGGPHTNALHSAKVEERLKEALRSLDSPRDGAPHIGPMADDVQQVIYSAQADRRQPVRRAYQVIKAAPAAFADATAEALVGFEGEFSEFAKRYAHAPSWRRAASAVAAIIGHENMKVGEVHRALEENQALWEYEDANIPAELRLTLKIYRRDKPPINDHITLRNIAPDDARMMRYLPPLSSSGEGKVDSDQGSINIASSSGSGGSSSSTSADSSSIDAAGAEDAHLRLENKPKSSSIFPGWNYTHNLTGLKATAASTWEGVKRPSPEAQQVGKLTGNQSKAAKKQRPRFSHYAEFVRDLGINVRERLPGAPSKLAGEIEAALAEAFEQARLLDHTGIPADRLAPGPSASASSAPAASASSLPAPPRVPYAGRQLARSDRNLLGPHDLLEMLHHFEMPVAQLRLFQPAARLQELLNAIHEKASKLPNTPSGHPGRPGLPLFGALTDAGIGSWAFLLADRASARPEGSSAIDTNNRLPWYSDILRHRGWRGGANLYIRGHLLNDHLGGPSAAYNLVPLVGAKNIDSAEVNTEHEVAMESIAKEAIREMDRQIREDDKLYHDPANEIEYVAYSSVVRDPRQPDRAGTHHAYRANALFDGLREKENRIPADDQKVEVERLHKSINSLHGNDVNILRTAVNQFDVPPNQMTYQDMAGFLQDNANLWNYEDHNVPSEIDLRIQIRREDGSLNHFKYTLVNIISDDEYHMIYRTDVGR